MKLTCAVNVPNIANNNHFDNNEMVLQDREGYKTYFLLNMYNLFDTNCWIY
jgi:hypothetical protein